MTSSCSQTLALVSVGWALAVVASSAHVEALGRHLDALEGAHARLPDAARTATAPGLGGLRVAHRRLVDLALLIARERGLPAQG